jgi:hypothetical protein
MRAMTIEALVNIGGCVGLTVTEAWAEAGRRQALITDRRRGMADAYVMLGQVLLALRGQYPTGTWQSTLTAHGIHVKSAQRAIALAEIKAGLRPNPPASHGTTKPESEATNLSRRFGGVLGGNGVPPRPTGQQNLNSCAPVVATVRGGPNSCVPPLEPEDSDEVKLGDGVGAAAVGDVDEWEEFEEEDGGALLGVDEDEEHDREDTVVARPVVVGAQLGLSGVYAQVDQVRACVGRLMAGDKRDEAAAIVARCAAELRALEGAA